MRKPTLAVASIVAAAVAALLSASSAPARNQDPRSTADPPPSPGCSSYEKAPDGSWRQIPCAPIGDTAAPPRRRGNDNSQASTRN